jgi:integrase
MNLTKTTIERLPSPETGYQIHWDEKLAGFGVRITPTGAKSFIFQKRINGKEKRITIGRYGELTAEQARKQAVKLAGQIASGGDPVAEKKEAGLKAVTLAGVFSDYLNTRKDLKPKTLKDYERVIGTAFADWRGKPLLSITKDMVGKRHKQLGEQNGEAWANLSMRVLRALFNFAAGQYEDAQGRSLVADNPVKRLSQTRAWYRVDRRQTVIKVHELKPWFEGVMKLDNKTLRDYLLLMMFTGLRRNEAATLKWSDIDLVGRTLTVQDTKNHQAHTLPLSDYLFDLLNRRKAEADNSFVFPGTGAGGYIVEPRKQMARVTESSGVQFTVHDLRRTFITLAESLDISAYAVKRLVNHKIGKSDVTAGYIVHDVERLRDPMQKITDYVLKMAGLKATAKVIEMKREANAS